MIGHRLNILRSLGLGSIAVLVALHAGCGSTATVPGAGNTGGGGGGGTAAGAGGGGGEAGGGSLGAGGGGGGGAITPDGGGGGSGGSDGGDDGSASDDGGVNVDAGGPSSGPYPPAGLTIDVAQVVNGGGAVLATPTIVTVTYSSDPDVATYNALGDAIGPSSYWHTINSEYGVGQATSGSTNHVVVTPTPTTIADTDIDNLVDTNPGAGWPANTANTIYMVYLPPGVPFTSQGQDQCATSGGGQLGGYHTTSPKNNYVYGIALHCSNFQTADVELSASHELNEAATDPLNTQQTAWVGFDANHLSFEIFNAFQDELGDACENFVEATDAVDFTPYTVQRQWSNKSAAAGSHWCVPALNEPFYNVTYGAQTTLDTITANLTAVGGSATTTSKGFKVAVGASRTFQIEYFSDVQTQTGFVLDVHGTPSTDGAQVAPIATDQSGNNIANGDATVTIDNPVGSNGMTANVTITPTSFSTLGITFFYIRAVLPGAQQHHYLPILISQN